MDDDIKTLLTWEEAETLLKVKGASLRRIQNQKMLWERMNAEQSAEEVVVSTSAQTSKKPIWVLLILAALIGSYFYGQSEIQNLIPWEILNGNENS
jgi:hypothetical protein